VGVSWPPKGTAQSSLLSEVDERVRPTLVPDFDPEAFARDSETRQRSASLGGGQPNMEEARRLHLGGDHEAALFLLTHLLGLTPLDAEATTLATQCRTALERECLSSIGYEAAVLVQAISGEELKSFALDNISGFLLSLLDGTTSVETILDIAGMPRLLALRHLRKLLERGIIGPLSGSRMPRGFEHDSSPHGRKELVTEEMVSGVLPMEIGAPTLDAVPILLIGQKELEALNLAPRARMLVALVDDKMSVGQILVSTGMDAIGGTAVFEELSQDGVIAFV
jgi:hypothetical protein